MINQLRHEARILRKGGADARSDLMENAAEEVEKLQARVKDVERIKSEWEQVVQPAHDYVDSAGIAKLGESKVGALVESHKKLQAQVEEYERLHSELASALNHDAEAPSLCDLVAASREVVKERDALTAQVVELETQVRSISLSRKELAAQVKNVKRILDQNKNSLACRIEALQELELTGSTNSIAERDAQAIEYMCRQLSIGVEIKDQGMFDVIPLAAALEYAERVKAGKA
ncbi:hypothetical protein PR08_gp54 [Idiomarinaceae phage Phi1M2-2]|uniref:hypothetical protein n=1 Tax=Idiomarinaceae phage Phi1M2-2 TaxID=1527515 RepID=UPI0004F8934E|nr:hypothetical protein PR08_gp54 [Idiomarinaceae phage Phi1M2-2]AIM40811.1 hypothetical protein M22_054 [Idiomarinaceae phage Phi1M2-2]